MGRTNNSGEGDSEIMKRGEGAEVSNCEGLDGNGDKEALLGQGGSMREETGEFFRNRGNVMIMCM